MTVYRNGFGVECLAARVPFQERIDHFQGALVKKNREWANNIACEESMKRECQIIGSIQYRSFTTSRSKSIEVFPDDRRPVTLFHKKAERLSRQLVLRGAIQPPQATAAAFVEIPARYRQSTILQGCHRQLAAL